MLMELEKRAARPRKPPRPTGVDEMLDNVAHVLKLDRTQLHADPHFTSLCDLVRGMVVNGNERGEPVRETFARLGDRWSSLLLFLLRSGPFRHSTLRRLVCVTAAERNISQRMLTLRLRNLERDGFIQRTVDDSVPPKVEYSLTPLGLALADQAMALITWVGAHSNDVVRARTAFDERSRSASGKARPIRNKFVPAC
jgi:DNA-binding HxlR family transcriptional regulator